MAHRTIRLDASEARNQHRISVNARIVNFLVVPVDIDVHFDHTDSDSIPVTNPWTWEKCDGDGLGYITDIFLTHEAGAGEIVIVVTDGGLRAANPLV